MHQLQNADELVPGHQRDAGITGKARLQAHRLDIRAGGHVVDQ